MLELIRTLGQFSWWPFVTVWALCYFAPEIRNLLRRLIEFKAFGATFKFAIAEMKAGVAEIKQSESGLALAAPINKIEASISRLEVALDAIGIEVSGPIVGSPPPTLATR